MQKLTEAQRQVIEHSLGLGRSKVSHRNFFCAGDDHDDMPAIRELIDAGCMRLSHQINQGRDGIYVVTPAGRALLDTLTEEKRP